MLVCTESVKYLSDPGVPGPIFVSGCPSLTHRPCADLTDVTLADADYRHQLNILILTDDRAIQGNVAMHVQAQIISH